MHCHGIDSCFILVDESIAEEKLNIEVARDDQIPSSSGTEDVDESAKMDHAPSVSVQRSTSNGSDLSKIRKRPPKIVMTEEDWLKARTEISALIRKPSQGKKLLLGHVACSFCHLILPAAGPTAT